MTNTKEKRNGKTIIIVLKNDKKIYTLFQFYKYFIFCKPKNNFIIMQNAKHCVQMC